MKTPVLFLLLAVIIALVASCTTQDTQGEAFRALDLAQTEPAEPLEPELPDEPATDPLANCGNGILDEGELCDYADMSDPYVQAGVCSDRCWIDGTEDGWLGCRGNGANVCVEEVMANKYDYTYYSRFPLCKPNYNCSNATFRCNEVICPDPTTYCRDTDNQASYYFLPGTTYGYNQFDGNFSYSDFCVDDSTLTEYQCDGDLGFTMVNVTCEYGCVNGQCICDYNYCNASEGLSDPYTKAYLNGLALRNNACIPWTREDVCTQPGVVVDYVSCRAASEHVCYYGCEDGACLHGEDDVQIQITSDPHNQIDPEKSGSTIVYADDRNGNWDIYAYELGSMQERRLTTDPLTQWEPQINGVYVVWVDGNQSDIVLYRLDTNETRRITNDPYRQNHPDVYGNYIIWEDNRHGRADVYLYNIAENTTTWLTPGMGGAGPAISFSRAVWISNVNGNKVYQYDLATKQISQVTNTSSEQREPATYYRWIAWDDWRDHISMDIYVYDTKTGQEIRVTNETSRQRFPLVSWSWVVWADDRNDLGSFPNDLYGYNFYSGRTVPLVVNDYFQANPSMDGDDFLLWNDNRNGNQDIFLMGLKSLS